MKISDVKLETVCGITSVLPAGSLPEIAFAGKSNVGKSSLINVLLERRNLARTSSSPGKTRTINFYRINRCFFLVDLPGYGYAKVSQEERGAWGGMIERYLHRSGTLRAVFLLLDIRREPGEHDRQMYEWIRSSGFTPVLIVTKTDKLSRTQAKEQIRRIRESLDAAQERLIPFSALTREGREEILEVMEEILGTAEQDELTAKQAGAAGNARDAERAEKKEYTENTENTEEKKAPRKPRWTKERKAQSRRRQLRKKKEGKAAAKKAGPGRR